jgi:ABC-type cobalamin/Fe3+-siderophores transport system ATPase subunit
LRALGPVEEVVTAEILSEIYRTEVRVEQTSSGHRVCVPGWGAGSPFPKVASRRGVS